MTDYISARGLRIDVPEVGDIVTVKIKPPSGAKVSAHTRPTLLDMIGGGSNERPEHENIHHYRINAIWEVVAVNGGHTVVRPVWTAYGRESRAELWVTAHHEWYDASDLYAALKLAEVDHA